MTIARDLSYVAALVASSSANVVFDDTIVLNGGTANGVLYLDSNKVVTTGSALRFDGSKFRVAAPSGVNMEVYETSSGAFNRIVISQQNTVSTYNSTYSTGTGAHAWQIGNAEYMRLDSAGNLGIGTSSPGAKLAIQNGTTEDVSGSAIRMELSGINPYWEIQGLNGGIGADRKLNFYTSALGGQSVLTLTQTGNVGIGTSSPGAKLHVVQASSAALGAQIALHNTAASAIGNAVEISLLTDAGASPSGIRNGRIRVVNENVGDGRASMQFWTWNGSTDVERARITSEGNFAVGESSSTEVITARRDGTGQYTTIQAKNANSTAVLNVGVGGSLVGNTPLRNNAYVMNASSSSLVFGTGDIERARITSGGDFGIGTSSPIYKFDVNGRIRGSDIGLTSNTNWYYFDSFGGSYFMGLNGGSDLQIYVNASQRARITGAGHIAKITTTGIDGTFDNLIKYGTAADIGSTTAQANRWIGIDASVTAGAAVNNVLRIRAYPGSTGNAAPVNVADFRGDQSTILYGKFDVITSSNKKIQVKDATHDTLTTNLGSAITFSRPTDGSDDLSALFTVDNGGLVLAAREGLIFATGGTTQYSATTERARITSGGDLLVGATSSASNTDSGFKVQANVSGQDHFDPLVVTGVNNAIYSCWDIYSTATSSYQFYVTTTGVINAVNTTISAISDQRLKENVRDLDVGLNAIMALKPRKFDWKAGKGKDIKGDRGFIAQEFEQVFPDLIDEWKDPAPEGEEPYKAVRADLIPVLVKAIQELKAQNDALLSRIEALESKLPE